MIVAEWEKTITELVLTYMPQEIFANTWRRHPELLDQKVSEYGLKVFSGVLALCDQQVVTQLSWRFLGAVKTLIFAFGCLCWAKTLFTFRVNCGIKIISPQNKQCWCILLKPLLLYNICPLPVILPEQKRLLFHWLSSFTANFILLDSLFYICICVK